MLTTVSKIVRRAMSMCDISYKIFRISLFLSCVMLFMSLFFLVKFILGGHGDYYIYNCSIELLRMPFPVLLLGIIASVSIEDMVV